MCDCATALNVRLICLYYMYIMLGVCRAVSDFNCLNLLVFYQQVMLSLLWGYLRILHGNSYVINLCLDVSSVPLWLACVGILVMGHMLVCTGPSSGGLLCQTDVLTLCWAACMLAGGGLWLATALKWLSSLKMKVNT